MADVSIIVPIYNVEKYIAKCIESIKMQTFTDFVCYLISDGSTDKSICIAENETVDDKRFIIIEKENGGYGSVLEYAIGIIKTEYFLVCDPDDYLDVKCLKELVLTAKKYNLDLIAGSRTNIFENTKNQEKDSMIDFSSYRIKPNEIINKNDKQYYKFLCLNPAPHSKLYRTSLSKKIIFSKKVSYTDNMLFYLSAINAKKVMYIDKYLYYYLIDRTGNSMSEKELKSLKQHLIVFNSILDQCENTDVDFIYFRLFQSFKEMFYRYGKLGIYDEEIYSNLQKYYCKLMHKKSFILKYYNSYTNERIVARIKDMILLSDLFGKTMFNKWLKKLGVKHEI